MEIPTALLKAAVAGLALATTATACDKSDLRNDDQHTEECVFDCVDPEAHQADPNEYYCPPCGMG